MEMPALWSKKEWDELPISWWPSGTDGRAVVLWRLSHGHVLPPYLWTIRKYDLQWWKLFCIGKLYKPWKILLTQAFHYYFHCNYYFGWSMNCLNLFAQQRKIHCAHSLFHNNLILRITLPYMTASKNRTRIWCICFMVVNLFDDITCITFHYQETAR